MPATKLLQVRNVSPRLHRLLKARAAQQGLTLSDYLRTELERISEQPTIEDWVEEVRGHAPVRLKRSAATLVRDARESR